MSTRLELPPGRLVWGNPAKSQIKKHQNGPDKGKPVMKDGKPVEQWVWGVAIEANAFIGAVWPAMEGEAKTIFTQGIPPQFSWKYKDGTKGIDRSGKPYNQREGYNGHFVLNISTEAFAPPIYKFENGKYRQLTALEIKTGDWVDCTFDFQAKQPSNNAHTPGLYVNPVAILHVGYGTEIVHSPDPEQLFGQQPRQFALPAGVSQTPISPNPGFAPPSGGAPGPGYQQPPAGGPAAYPQATPGYTPPNNTAFTGGGQGYPPQQQQYAPQPGPGPQQPGQGGYPPPNVAPAHDFVQNAGQQQQPGYPPQQQQPGYPPQQQQYAPQPGPGPQYPPQQQTPGYPGPR